MKAIIDKDGYLIIKRMNLVTKQCCPYTWIKYCRDTCPLFGEPVYTHLSPIETKLKLCHTTLCFRGGEFRDDRE